MKITVVVTTYNRPDFLGKVLEGYQHQRRFPDELVVADDGSGPATKEVVDAYRRRSCFPVLHAWQEDIGVRECHVRNLATRQSSGDYVIYTDGDCIPGPWFVRDHEVLAAPGWFVQGRRFMVQAKGNAEVTGRERGHQLLWLWLRGGIRKPHHVLHIPGLAFRRRNATRVRACNLAVWREDVNRINGWNEKFVGYWRQDSEFVVRLLRAGVKRKDALFSTALFHLHHSKPLVQEDLDRNTKLLEAAWSGPIFVPEGLVQSAPAGPVSRPQADTQEPTQ
jgi:glycosyltransferase involved in cell wall biosynthesis